MTDTQQLLERFVNHGSEAAFRDLVTRYFDLVYSTAVRQVDGDTHTAKDVAQIVFGDLARKAGTLSAGTMLGGWLHRHTCFVARTLMRGERRRLARERQAVEMNALNSQGISLVALVSPILDEAINELGPDDRHAILLRFFEHHDLRSVGEAMGMTENAAQKRVARALKELGNLLQKRGITVTVAALASGLASGAVTAAPTGLALEVAGAAFADVSTTGSIGSPTFKLFTGARLKTKIAAIVVVVTMLSAILLKRQTTDIAQGSSHMPDQQLVQQQVRDSGLPDEPSSQSFGTSGVENLVLATPSQSVDQPQAGARELESSRQAGAAFPGTVRLYSRRGSKLRIEGTSNIGNWQAESSLIGGFLETGPGFPLEPGANITPGAVLATGEAFIMVQSLLSIEKDGKPYSAVMDQTIYKSLRAELFPKIRYRVLAMSFKGATNRDDLLQYQYESHGELSIAGITNKISMPIFVLPMGDYKLKITGRTTIKMTSFQVTPPAPKIALGQITTGDEVMITFSWIIGLRPPGEQSPGTTPVALQPPLEPGNRNDPATNAEDVLVPGMLQFINTDVAQVLLIYTELAQGQMDVDETVRQLRASISLTNSEPLTIAQALLLLDNALLEQAGVVVTHPATNHVMMTLRR